MFSSPVVRGSVAVVSGLITDVHPSVPVPSRAGIIIAVRSSGSRYVDAGIQFFTRRGHDWLDRFRALKGPFGQLNTHSAIIDGEVIVQTANGASDFGALQKELRAGRSDRLVFYAFDLLHLTLSTCALRIMAATAAPYCMYQGKIGDL